jgi:hypothetical protein
MADESADIPIEGHDEYAEPESDGTLPVLWGHPYKVEGGDKGFTANGLKFVKGGMYM